MDATQIPLSIRSESNQAVVVDVAPADLFDLMEAMGCLPGHFPPLPQGAPATGGYRGAWLSLKERAPRIIEMCCTVAGGAVPLDVLTEHEQFLLVATALQVSGWYGGPADRVARFPGLDGGAGHELRGSGPEASSSGNGSGVVAAMHGDGAEPIATVPAPAGVERG